MVRKTNRKRTLGRGTVAQRALGRAADSFGTEIQPLGEEAGVLAVRVGRLLISGLAGAVYGLEQVAEWMRHAVAERLKGLPEEKITKPNPRIAVPATQALVYCMSESLIREMFANLLAADMNLDTKRHAHPAFVGIIREMTSTEAKILQVVSKRPQMRMSVEIVSSQEWREIERAISFSIEGAGLDVFEGLSNLERLRLIEIRRDVPLGELEMGDLKVDHPYLAQPEDELPWRVAKVGITLTPLGESFVDVCLPKGNCH